jgi:formate-dependent nitrite reductase membrane component NrfD
MEGQIFVLWNWSVAVYLFIAGVSAGAFAISALAYFIGKEPYERIVRIGAYIAPFPVLIGILCLIYDLERPHLFWRLFLTFRPNSVMSLGSWLLLFFSIFSFLHFYLWLPERFELLRILQWIPQRFDKMKIIKAIKSSSFLARWHRENLLRWRGWVALTGILLSIFVGIYTGVLLGALVARPFWNNPILPLLFLLSALKTGTASILFVGLFLKGFHGMKKEEMETNKLLIHSIDLILMVFSIISIFLFIFGMYVSTKSSAEAAKLIMGGEFTFLFWVLAVGVGILFPLALGLYELIPHFIKGAELREYNPWVTGVVTTSVLLGGFMLRYVVIYAGQMAQIISS